METELANEMRGTEIEEEQRSETLEIEQEIELVTIEIEQGQRREPLEIEQGQRPLEIEQGQSPEPLESELGQSPEPLEFEQGGLQLFNEFVKLHNAALKGDWRTAKKLLKDNPGLVGAKITARGETALHLAAAEGRTYFVKQLLKNIEPDHLIIQNHSGYTALCVAAAAGNVRIARRMVNMDPGLTNISNELEFTPLYMAAWQGHRRMTRELFRISDVQSWSPDDLVELLQRFIDLGVYDIAKKIVEENNTLATRDGRYGETPLLMLARMPSAFSSTSRHGFWWNSVSPIFSCLKLKACNKFAPSNADALLECLWRNAAYRYDVEAAEPPEQLRNLLFAAAESGNYFFLVHLFRRHPDLKYVMNHSRHSIFHIAVSHRHVEVFNLLYDLHGVKDLIISQIDHDENNILHLAAKLAPLHQLNRIPGAALQMQREILWYKEVQKIVPPSYINMKNTDLKTPNELFLEGHGDLMKKGEKQMKQIAKSCMLVAILIATVVFGAAFTVPGNYNNEGAPILRRKKLFVVFSMCEAIATLSSLTSMLMFLSVLISRYTEKDFLWSLPCCLVVGIATLFASTVAMIVAFASSIFFYKLGYPVKIVLVVLCICVPSIFLILKGPLFINIACFTRSSRWLFRSKNRL